MWVSDALSFHELKNCYFITSINLIVAFKTASKQYLANSVTKIITHANYPYTNTVVSFLCRKLDYITNSQWFKSYDVSIFFLPFHFHLDIEMTVFFHFLKFVCFFSCNSNSTTKIMEIFQKKTYQILKMFLLKTFIFTVLISKIIYMYIIDIYITDIYIYNWLDQLVTKSDWLMSWEMNIPLGFFWRGEGGELHLPSVNTWNGIE